LDLKPLLTLKLKEMDNRKFWYWLQSVIGLIGFLSDKFLVGYFTNIKILGLYSIASLIGSQLHNAFSSIGNFMFPRVANMKSNDEDVSQLYFNSRFVIASLSLFVNLILVIVGPWIFNWWLGPETYNQNAEIINLYLVYISLLSLCIIPYQFINASRNLRFNSFFELFLRITHIVSMLLGFYVHGLSGLIYGLIISTLLALPFEYYFFQKYFFKINSVLRALEVVLPFIGFITFVFFGNFYFSCVSLIFILISFYFIYIRKINLIDWKK
jgi:O-antigen/teichoic acid export membrane protein